MNAQPRIGVIALCRPTFDVEFAGERLGSVIAAVRKAGMEVLPESPQLLMDDATVEAAVEQLLEQGADDLLVVQATFTDADGVVAAALRWPKPIAIWAPNEPRTGGRLRLNAFCGLNLAGHALGLRELGFNWMYGDPDRSEPARTRSLFEFSGKTGRPEPVAAGNDVGSRAQQLVDRLYDARIGKIGNHPSGFDTCRSDVTDLPGRTGVTVEKIELPELLNAARRIDSGMSGTLASSLGAYVSGLDEVDQEQLGRSLRLKAALDNVTRERGLDAVAIRCWPEMFTEYGGAVCGPVSLLGDAGIPCACEADVNGALTQLVLQYAADAPVFLADIVDMDPDDDTGVLWHCGQAPLSMRDPEASARATVHTNRKQPLLFEFPLKPGRVTIMRISQAFGEPSLVLTGGEMLRRPLAYSGTSGVVKFDNPAAHVMAGIIDGGLEHHVAVAYGEHRPLLREVAVELDLPILEL